jgi:hypothetical protein
VIDLDHVEAARRLFDPQHWSRNRGLIRSMSGPGQQLLWEVVRQPKISA